MAHVCGAFDGGVKARRPRRRPRGESRGRPPRPPRRPVCGAPGRHDLRSRAPCSSPLATTEKRGRASEIRFRNAPGGHAQAGSPMEPRIHVLTLAVGDLERVLAFYRDGRATSATRMGICGRSSPTSLATRNSLGGGVSGPGKSSDGHVVPRFPLHGAAPESNRASLGLPDLTGFEDPLGHRPPPLHDKDRTVNRFGFVNPGDRGWRGTAGSGMLVDRSREKEEPWSCKSSFRARVMQ